MNSGDHRVGEALQERQTVQEVGAELRQESDFRRRLFSFPAVLIAGLAVVAVLTVSNRFNDPDLWFHLKLGQIVWTTHCIPSTDTFSFTAYGHAWTAHEWLAELSIYAAYRMGGYSGLMLWLAALTSVLLILVYFLCYRCSGNALVSFLGGLCAWFFGTVGLAIRPLLLGHVFLVIELILLEWGSRNRRCLWGLPPLFAVWVNCHGSYFFGMGILFVYWICSFANGKWGLVAAEPWDRKGRNWLGAILILCGVALCCNPVGIRLLLYPLDTFFRQHTGLNAVDEWLPPDMRSGRALGMIGAVIGLLVVPLLRRSELRLRELLVLGMAFALALQHQRMLFLFGIVVSPALCRVLAPVLGADREREHPIANAVLIFACLIAVAWGFPAHASIQEQVRKGNPAGAVDYIRRANLSGPMLNEYVFGDYLIWALPEEKVFIDGRGDVFDWTGVFQEYGRWATLAEDPQVLLKKYHVRLCLLSKGAPMAQVMAYLPGWSKAYSDNVAVVFVR
jgi:hypothetical protein